MFAVTEPPKSLEPPRDCERNQCDIRIAVPGDLLDWGTHVYHNGERAIWDTIVVQSPDSIEDDVKRWLRSCHLYDESEPNLNEQ